MSKVPIRRAAGLALSAVCLVLLVACDVRIPSADPSPSAAPTYAKPTVVPGHDAAKVAAQPMTFEAGKTLSPSVAVNFVDKLAEPDSSQDPAKPSGFVPVRVSQQGWSQYTYTNGCALNLWQSENQQNLMLIGDDRVSSERALSYVGLSMKTTQPKELTLPWTTDPAKPAPTVTFLSWQGQGPGGDAVLYAVRAFAQAGNSMSLSASCKNEAALQDMLKATAKRLSVAPPSA